MAAAAPSEQGVKASQQKCLKELAKLQTIVRTAKWTPANIKAGYRPLIDCIHMAANSPAWERKNEGFKSALTILCDMTRAVVADMQGTKRKDSVLGIADCEIVVDMQGTKRKDSVLGIADCEIVVDIALNYMKAGIPRTQTLTTDQPLVRAKVRALAEAGWIEAWCSLSNLSVREEFRADFEQLQHFVSQQWSLFLTFAYKFRERRRKNVHEATMFFIDCLFHRCETKGRDYLFDLMNKVGLLHELRSGSPEIDFYDCANKGVLHSMISSILPRINSIPTEEQLPGFSQEDIVTFHVAAAKTLYGMHKHLPTYLPEWGALFLRVIVTAAQGPAGLETYLHALIGEVIGPACGQVAYLAYGEALVAALETAFRRMDGERPDAEARKCCLLSLLHIMQNDVLLPDRARARLEGAYLQARLFEARTLSDLSNVKEVVFSYFLTTRQNGEVLDLDVARWMLTEITNNFPTDTYTETTMEWAARELCAYDGIDLQQLYEHPVMWQHITEKLDDIRGQPVDSSWYETVGFPARMLSHIARTPIGCRAILARPGVVESVVDAIHALIRAQNQASFDQMAYIIVSVLLQADSLSESQREWIRDLAQRSLVEGAWPLGHYIAALALPIWPESEQRLRVEQLCERLNEAFSTAAAIEDSAQLEYASLALWTLIEFASTSTEGVKAVVDLRRKNWVAFCAKVTNHPQNATPNTIEAATETLRLLDRLK